MAQSLIDVMGKVRGGFALNQAGKKLAEVVRAVAETGKKGSVTFTITVEQDKNDANIVTVKPAITAKIPEKGYTEGIFFVGQAGELTLEDPRQKEMFEERKDTNVANLAQVGRGPTTS